jgi:hypothetical protein
VWCGLSRYSYPNLVGYDYTQQTDSAIEFDSFVPLINMHVRKGGHVKFFLCSVYQPMCTDKVRAWTPRTVDMLPTGGPSHWTMSTVVRTSTTDCRADTCSFWLRMATKSQLYYVSRREQSTDYVYGRTDRHSDINYK